MFFLLACISTPDDAPPRPLPEDSTTTAPSGPDSACNVPGCVRKAWSYGDYDRAAIAPYLEEGVELENGYSIWGIEYLTADERTATATVTLPIDLAGNPPEKGFPVVANAHGTIGLEDACTLTGTLSGTGLAALFGGRGAIGVAPDYVGLGSPGVHRYLDAEQEAFAVLDSLRSALQLSSWQGVLSSGRSAIVGLSQGGHAVLSAAAWHSRYAPELDIRAFGASGPADVYEEQWAPAVSIPGDHLVMHAMLAWSFSEAAGMEDSGVWAPSIADRIDSRLTTRCTWSPNATTEALMGDDFPTAPSDIFSADFLQEYSTGSWNHFSAIHERFEANRVRPWLEEGEQTAPLAIWQGTKDATILPSMTRSLVRDLREGDIEVELHEVEGGTHTTTAFGFLAIPELATEESVAWVKERLEAEP